MFKRLKKLLIAGALACSLAFTTTSCSLFGQADDGVMIAAISAKSNSKGDTELTITFTDEDIEPVTFLIPKGEKGETGEIGQTGVGVESITSSQSEDGLHTILTITYTDKTIEPTIIEVANGVSVIDIDSAQDLDNNATVVTFTLSDNSQKAFAIPNGKDGKDGVGIESVDTAQDPVTNDFIVTIKYTGGQEDTVITLPYKNGEDGRGIQSIVGNQYGNEYIITINYSDGTSEELAPIQVPQTNVWMYGRGAPTSMQSDYANDGDYYFDIENYVIYLFTGGEFHKIIDLTADNIPGTKYDVTFDPNGGHFVTEQFETIKVVAGRPIELSRIPVCEKEGMTFAGWYTTPEGPANPMSGRLTDLTPIWSNMTFYAQYK